MSVSVPNLSFLHCVSGIVFTLLFLIRVFPANLGLEEHALGVVFGLNKQARFVLGRARSTNLIYHNKHGIKINKVRAPCSQRYYLH